MAKPKTKAKTKPPVQQEVPGAEAPKIEGLDDDEIRAVYDLTAQWQKLGQEMRDRRHQLAEKLRAAKASSYTTHDGYTVKLKRSEPTIQIQRADRTIEIDEDDE